MTNEVLQKIASDEQNISSSNGLEPKLRFKEFDGKWSRNILGNCCDIIMGQSPDSSSYNNNCIGLPLVQGNADMCERIATPQRYTSQPTKICEAGSIILSVRAPVGTVGKTFQKICLGRGVCGITSKNIEFMYQYLLNNENSWRHIEQGGTFTAINSDDIKSFPIILPSLPEQKKIADFLSLIDQRIEKQRQLVENLKKYKRGLFFEIFEQKRRFKDGNNKFYPKWEKKSLGTIFKERTERAIGNEELLSVTINSGVKKRCEVDVKDNSSDDKSKYKKLYPNDIAYNTMRMWQGASGVSLYEGIVSPAYTVITTIIPVKIGFFGYYFKYIKTIQIFQKFSQGLTSDTWNLKYPQLSEIQLLIPNIEEQEKIYETFKFLDDKILLSENTLNLLQDIKKGLLQKMFI